MLSFWEKSEMSCYDLVIVGAGITGLNTALELRELYPEKSITVLERGLDTEGASTKNAGFACMGSVTELLDDLKYSKTETVIALFELRYKGLLLLRKRLGSQQIDYQEEGSYELISESEQEADAKIEELNAMLSTVLPGPAFCLEPAILRKSGFNENRFSTAIKNNFEGSLNTGKMMQRLQLLCIARNIIIKTGTSVLEMDKTARKLLISVNNETKELIYNKLFVCTNAFTGALIPGAAVVPGRGQVLITKPIPGLKPKGIFHMDQGYYYFRNIGDRLLIGGGRNLDFAGEQTTIPGLTEHIQGSLEEKLQQDILPGISYEVEQRWSGIMGFGKGKYPIIEQFGENEYTAYKLGGMGIAIGTMVAKMLVALFQTHENKRL